MGVLGVEKWKMEGEKRGKRQWVEGERGLYPDPLRSRQFHTTCSFLAVS